MGYPNISRTTEYRNDSLKIHIEVDSPESWVRLWQARRCTAGLIPQGCAVGWPYLFVKSFKLSLGLRGGHVLRMSKLIWHRGKYTNDGSFLPIQDLCGRQPLLWSSHCLILSFLLVTCQSSFSIFLVSSLSYLMSAAQSKRFLPLLLISHPCYLPIDPLDS